MNSNTRRHVIRRIPFVAFVAFAVVAVTKPASAESYVLGVWNIEKLSPSAKRGFPELKGGQQYEPRTDDQLKRIARYIRDELKVAALMVTEVEATYGHTKPGSSQLDTIVEEMGPTWEYLLGRAGGNLRIGIVYDRKRVRIKQIAEFTVDEFTIQEEDIFDRDPLIVWVALRDSDGEEMNDLLMIGLHLKSVQSYRDNHLVACAKLLTELKRFKREHDIHRAEKDIMILGDLSDSAHTRRRFKYLFDYMKDKYYTHLGPTDDTYPATRINGSQIDHIFISSGLKGHEVDPQTFKVHGPSEAEAGAYRETYSDHYPLTVEIKLQEDDN